MHEYTQTFTPLSGMKVQYECTKVDKGWHFLMNYCFHECFALCVTNTDHADNFLTAALCNKYKKINKNCKTK